MSPASPTSTSSTDSNRDLAVAADGSFVETTSAAAARAMAAFYAQQGKGEGQGEGREGGEEYGVVRVERDGKAVYRIRPLPKATSSSPTSPTSFLSTSPSNASGSGSGSGSSSSSSPASASSSAASGHIPFSRPSHQPSYSPAPGTPVEGGGTGAGGGEPTPTIALHRSSVRHAWSNPLLRSDGVAGSPSQNEGGSGGGLLSPDRATFLPSSTSSSFSSATPSAPPALSHHPSASVLRKPTSSPSLRPSSTLFSSPPSSSPRPPPPGLASAPNLEPRGRSRPSSSTEGDVLGRILGWREGMGREGREGSGRGRRDRGTGSARVQEVFADGRGKERGGKGSKGSEGSDKSDLPEDLVEILDAASAPHHPFASSTTLPSSSSSRRPSFIRANTSSAVFLSPFGAGVRIPRSATAQAALGEAVGAGAGVNGGERRSRSENDREGVEVLDQHGAGGGENEREKHIKEVSSNDSIRTATAEDPLPHLAIPSSSPSSPPSSDSPAHDHLPPLDLAPAPPLKLRRFENPSIFDVFHRPSSIASPPAPSSSTSPPHPNPIAQHGRLPSSASLASSLHSQHSTTSDASSGGGGGGAAATGQQITIAALGAGAVGDDPRFCIWGYRDGTPSSSSTKLPSSPPPPPFAAAPPSVAPSTPGRQNSSDLRRQSIAEEGDDEGEGGDAGAGGVGSKYPSFTSSHRRPSHASPASSTAASSPAGSSRRWSVSHRTSSGGGSPATSVRDSVSSSGDQQRHEKKAGSEQPKQRILMAATVERLVAELTSQISAELLPFFFLTYRHFLAPLDLLRLLLTRFDWTLLPPSSSSPPSPEDEATRRIVRVRTFVVLRYWLMNSHFLEDFYPSREMRGMLTGWLNERGRDERLRVKGREGEMKLIKQLKKTVRRVRDMYGPTGLVPRPPPSASIAAARKNPDSGSGEDVDFDEQPVVPPVIPRSAGSLPIPSNPPTSATSTSFGFSSLRLPRSGTTTGAGRPKLPIAAAAFSDDEPAHAATTTTTNNPFPLPLDSSLSAQNPIVRSFSNAMGTFGRIKRKVVAHAAHMQPRSAASSSSLPEADEGRAGGGKRELELERSKEGDLWWVKGGVEAYLEVLGIKREEEVIEEEQEDEEGEEGTPQLVRDEEGTPKTEDGSGDAATPRPDDGAAGDSAQVLTGEHDGGAALGLGIVTTDHDAVSSLPVTAAPSASYSFPPKSALLSFTPTPTTALPPPPPSSAPAFLPAFTSPAAAPTPPPVYTFTLDPSLTSFARPHSTRIELDDLPDSEDDSDVAEVQQKTVKRAPKVKNLRLFGRDSFQPTLPPHHLQRSAYRRSMESEMSAFGAVLPSTFLPHHGAGVQGLGLGEEAEEPPRASFIFLDEEEGLDGGQGQTPVPGFIIDGLLDSEDEDEPGDVEAALRRLEGLVDDAKEREKKRRVERQLERSRREEERRERRKERALRGDLLEGSEAEEEEEEEEEEEGFSTAASSRKGSLAAAPDAPVTLLEVPVEVDQSQREAAFVLPSPSTAPSAPPVPPGTLFPPTTSIPATLPPPVGYSSAKSPPLSRIQSNVQAAAAPSFRKPSLSRIFNARPLSTRPTTHLAAPSSSSSSGPAPPSHRSFLLYCRTDELCRQFTLIERDLLRMLSYQELVSGAWRESVGTGETDVLNWEEYLKERRRSDLEAREKGEGARRSGVKDVVARFNLTCNWVATEILLTANLEERAYLVAKFIRLAFKCYCACNYQTLCQIVHGLLHQDVERLRKTWAKVPSWEIRKFRGMREFVSHLKNFKYLRNATNAILSEYGGLLSGSSSGESAKGCIPFLGIFLRDLVINAELPTFLDPTSPSTPASVDSSGSLTSLADPHAFDSLSLPPLPPSMPLRPLVNVHKFRVLAQTVTTVQSLQELAQARFTHEPIPQIFFKCLKIRCLEQSVLHQLSAALEA
ncbi:hypothetical protein JCM8547_001550 [Rhodosporidiobolus lusitaniae]